DLGFSTGGTLRLDISTTAVTSTLAFALNQAALTGSPATTVALNPGNHTALTASTEYISFALIAASQQFATGAIATQRYAVFASPTYTAVGASVITTAATVAITDAPTAFTNVTINNSYALWVQ